MHSIRRAVLLLLLLTVPFQAAVGATGLLRANSEFPAGEVATTPHAHDAAMAAGHTHDANGSAAHYHPFADPGWHGSNGDAGTCKACNECCVSLPALPASPVALIPPDTLRVSATVEPEIVSRAGDGLFHPPRTLAA